MTSPFRCLYRLQLEPGRGFEHARTLVPYLRDLGVSHLYLSPVMAARSGSTHGYDVVDPTRVSDALGGESELRALAGEGLGLVIDVVPNHMAADDENLLWRDPLMRARFFDLDGRTGRHRRFFDVDGLGGVRVEDAEVFEVTHRKTLELVADGTVAGLRIDHPDGLAHPGRYLERLRERGAEHVWVEKILEPGEELRDWPVEGTTGYEFMSEATALFVDPAGEEPLTRLYQELTGERRSFREMARDAKLELAFGTFGEELERLASLVDPTIADERSLARAVTLLDVYRTYVDPANGAIDDADREVMVCSGVDPELLSVLTLERRGFDAFVTRFQQTTPAVMAKGVEDTALYRYLRLLALNEVGSDPARFGLSVDAFHDACLRRQQRQPYGLLSTTTHDTKRTADVRARLTGLSVLAGPWRELVERAHACVPAPDDPGAAYLVLQTLAGTWPVAEERLDSYYEKALREQKTRTNWLEPDLAFEDAMKSWSRALMEHAVFRERFDRFLPDLVYEARRASLGMVLLKLTTPGIPDIYQGDELEFRALVDPDNRRPVDWEASRAELSGRSAGTKTDVIRRVLGYRARAPEVFEAAYEPLEAGPGTCAFRRGSELVVAAAVRDDLAGFTPPKGAWRDLLAPDPHVRVLVRA